MALVGLLVHGGCPSDEPIDEPLTATEQLDACGLLYDCMYGTRWEGCANYDGWTYQDEDVCSFESLLGEPPAVVRAVYTEPTCEDASYGARLDIYRWADGTMTCVTREGGGTPGGTTFDTEVRECELPDSTMMEACLVAAQAGEIVSQACLDWREWGVEFGAAIEPTCGATGQ